MFTCLDTKKPVVIVVGAGLAGLAAANTLQSSGIVQVKLLEGNGVRGGGVSEISDSLELGKLMANMIELIEITAQSEPGGRIKTVELDGDQLELGAQWLHSAESSLYEYAHQKQLLNPVSWGESLGDFFRINGEKVSPQVVREVDEVISEITSSCASFYSSPSNIEIPRSVQDYLIREFNKYIEKSSDSEDVRKIKLELLGWHIRFQVIDNSCNNLDKLSAKFWGQYTPREQDHFCLKGGYSGVVRSLADSLEPGVLTTHFPVRQIHWTADRSTEEDRRPCRVISESGQEHRGHHVIVTCSVGVLKGRPDLFDPPLPSSHRKALNELGYDTVNKIFLLYKKQWWNDSTGFQLIWDSHEMEKRLAISEEEAHWTRYLTGFDTVQESPRALCGWVGGRGALEVEKLSENDIGTQCTQLLRQFLAKRDIPSPVKVIRSQWASNKYIRGGYCHITPLSDRSDSTPQDALKSPIFDHSSTDQCPRLFLAGEAVHKEQYSTAHGAYASGQSQAAALLSYLKARS